MNVMTAWGLKTKKFSMQTFTIILIDTTLLFVIVRNVVAACARFSCEWV